ncbi:MAG: class I SAM-dependent methyltransferase, partial [Actinomycetota bacterium]
VKKTFATYRRIGHRTVAGWLAPEVMEALVAIDERQRERKIAGAIAEIGVHHGRLFIALNLLRRNGEKAVAIDVFGCQELNIDQSGKGDLERFRANVERWSSSNGVEVHQGDSTLLQPNALQELAGGKVRLFSVDGGHTESIVYSDMNLAAACLVSGGVLIADDVFNGDWPGVATGTLRYMAQPDALVPFAIGFNKVFFSRPECAADYRACVQAHFRRRPLEMTKLSEYAGCEVLVISRVPRRPRAMLSRNELARELYRRIQQITRSKV